MCMCISLISQTLKLTTTIIKMYQSNLESVKSGGAMAPLAPLVPPPMCNIPHTYNRGLKYVATCISINNWAKPLQLKYFCMYIRTSGHH